MSLIGAGKSLGHWRPLLAAVAVFGMVLAFASAAAAQVGDSSNDQYKNRSSQYDQYSCSGCEPSSGCPDCGTGVGKDAKEIIGGPGDNAGKNDFSAALEAARSHRGMLPLPSPRRPAPAPSLNQAEPRSQGPARIRISGRKRVPVRQPTKMAAARRLETSRTGWEMTRVPGTIRWPVNSLERVESWPWEPL